MQELTPYRALAVIAIVIRGPVVIWVTQKSYDHIQQMASVFLELQSLSNRKCITIQLIIARPQLCAALLYNKCIVLL